MELVLSGRSITKPYLVIRFNLTVDLCIHMEKKYLNKILKDGILIMVISYKVGITYDFPFVLFLDSVLRV